MSLPTDLVDDRGAAAESEDFFRSRPFYDAEGVTHSLRVEGDGGRLSIPLIVREIPDSELRDATSPYGYPGGRLDAAGPLDPGEVAWEGTGLVAAFLRERLGEPCLRGGNRRGTAQLADPALPRKSRMSDRQQIRKNEARGYEIGHVAGPDASSEQRTGFERVYEQTMRRTDAGQRYFFSDDYFSTLFASPKLWLFEVTGPEGDVAAGALATLSDGLLHYFLSGTADEHLSNSPAKNLIAAVIDRAEELEVPMNLGGGIRPGDGLEEFKRGFANTELPFHTHDVVCDREAYDRLSAGREDTGFFPLYRAGAGAGAPD